MIEPIGEEKAQELVAQLRAVARAADKVWLDIAGDPVYVEKCIAEMEKQFA